MGQNAAPIQAAGVVVATMACMTLAATLTPVPEAKAVQETNQAPRRCAATG